MEEGLTKISGMRYSFSQPIELRVSELIAGVRSDVAIKLFGEDYAILKAKAEEIERVITPIRGAIARYGINV